MSKSITFFSVEQTPPCLTVSHVRPLQWSFRLRAITCGHRSRTAKRLQSSKRRCRDDTRISSLMRVRQGSVSHASRFLVGREALSSRESIHSATVSAYFCSFLLLTCLACGRPMSPKSCVSESKFPKTERCHYYPETPHLLGVEEIHERSMDAHCHSHQTI